MIKYKRDALRKRSGERECCALGGLLVEPALVWFLILIFLVVLESATTQLVAIWFALGALGALLVSLVTDSAPVQVTVFVIVSIVSLLLTRPYLRRYQSGKARLNLDRVIGAEALVVEDIDNAAESGAVSINGQIWTARSEDGTSIEKGVRAVVTRVEGVKVFVRIIKEESQ